MDSMVETGRHSHSLEFDLARRGCQNRPNDTCEAMQGPGPHLHGTWGELLRGRVRYHKPYTVHRIHPWEKIANLNQTLIPSAQGSHARGILRASMESSQAYQKGNGELFRIQNILFRTF